MGVSLSGGGVLGFAHIGALLAIEEAGVRVDCISGCSAGSLVAAAYAAGVSPNSLQKFGLSLSEWDFPWAASGILKAAWNGGRFLLDRRTDLTAGINHLRGTGPFFYKFNRLLDCVSFQGLKRPLAVVSTDLISGRPVVMSSMEPALPVSGYLWRTDIPLLTALHASIAMPVVFPPVAHEALYMVDGGLTHNNPVGLVRAMGAQYVIAIHLDPYQSQCPPASLMDLAERSVHLMLSRLSERDLDSATLVVSVPKRPDINAYSPTGADAYYQLGYQVTKRALQHWHCLHKVG